MAVYQQLTIFGTKVEYYCVTNLNMLTVSHMNHENFKSNITRLRPYDNKRRI